MTDLTHRNEIVTVHCYKVFDPESREMQVALDKATREAIAALHLVELVHGTAEDVPRDAVDAQGHFRRLATGWGELG